jgi:hypothetical protein
MQLNVSCNATELLLPSGYSLKDMHQLATMRKISINFENFGWDCAEEKRI